LEGFLKILSGIHDFVMDQQEAKSAMADKLG
jgi:hypothetical protein